MPKNDATLAWGDWTRMSLREMRQEEQNTEFGVWSPGCSWAHLGQETISRAIGPQAAPGCGSEENRDLGTGTASQTRRGLRESSWPWLEDQLPEPCRSSGLVVTSAVNNSLPYPMIPRTELRALRVCVRQVKGVSGDSCPFFLDVIKEEPSPVTTEGHCFSSGHSPEMDTRRHPASTHLSSSSSSFPRAPTPGSSAVVRCVSHHRSWHGVPSLSDAEPQRSHKHLQSQLTPVASKAHLTDRSSSPQAVERPPISQGSYLAQCGRPQGSKPGSTAKSVHNHTHLPPTPGPSNAPPRGQERSGFTLSQSLLDVWFP